MDRLSLAQCRQLIKLDSNTPVTDDQISRIRDLTYDLADIIIDAYTELSEQSEFFPTGTAYSQVDKNLVEMFGDPEGWFDALGGCPDEAI